MSTAHYFEFLTFGTKKKKEKTYFNIDINLSCDALSPLISSFLLTTLKFVKPAVLIKLSQPVDHPIQYVVLSPGPAGFTL